MTINYTVKSGDTLAAIARAFYGDPQRFRIIAASNGIADPNRIFVGQRLQIPDVDDLAEVNVTAQRIPEVGITRPVPIANGEPLPGVYALDEISGTAPRDYLPALIVGAIALYVLTDKKRF